MPPPSVTTAMTTSPSSPLTVSHANGSTMDAAKLVLSVPQRPLLRILSLTESFGPLVVMTFAMMVDVARWIVLLAVFMIAFAVGIWMLLRGQTFDLADGECAEFLEGLRDGGVLNVARFLLHVVFDSGDVLVFGGPARMVYHGVSKILPNRRPRGLVLAPGRLNLTFREL